MMLRAAVEAPPPIIVRFPYTLIGFDPHVITTSRSCAIRQTRMIKAFRRIEPIFQEMDLPPRPTTCRFSGDGEHCQRKECISLCVPKTLSEYDEVMESPKLTE